MPIKYFYHGFTEFLHSYNGINMSHYGNFILNRLLRILLRVTPRVTLRGK